MGTKKKIHDLGRTESPTCEFFNFFLAALKAGRRALGWRMVEDFRFAGGVISLPPFS